MRGALPVPGQVGDAWLSPALATSLDVFFVASFSHPHPTSPAASTDAAGPELNPDNVNPPSEDWAPRESGMVLHDA